MCRHRCPLRPCERGRRPRRPPSGGCRGGSPGTQRQPGRGSAILAPPPPPPPASFLRALRPAMPARRLPVSAGPAPGRRRRPPRAPGLPSPASAAHPPFLSLSLCPRSHGAHPRRGGAVAGRGGGAPAARPGEGAPGEGWYRGWLGGGVGWVRGWVWARGAAGGRGGGGLARCHAAARSRGVPRRGCSLQRGGGGVAFVFLFLLFFPSVFASLYFILIFKSMYLRTVSSGCVCGEYAYVVVPQSRSGEAIFFFSFPPQMTHHL